MLAQDVAQLVSLRSGMRARMKGSAVMDEVGFARDMEQAYQGMWQS